MTSFAVPDGTARDDAPASNDIGLVTRPIFSGPIDVDATPAPSESAGPVAVPASAASVQLLAPNPNRLGFSIRNTSTVDTLYVSVQTAASVGDHTVALVPGAYYEDPYRFVGEVFGMWAPGDSGSAMVTEYTAA